jgi:hypothetical protein
MILKETFQFQTTKILALKHQGGGANASSKFKPKKLQFFMKIKLILNLSQKNHFWKYYT